MGTVGRGRHSVPPPQSSRLFPGEAEKTSLGGEGAFPPGNTPPQPPISSTPIAALRGPRALECPLNLRVARHQDPQPSRLLGLARVRLLEPGVRASWRQLLLSLREASGVMGDVNGPAGRLAQQRGAQGGERARELWGDYQRDREREREREREGGRERERDRHCQIESKLPLFSFFLFFLQSFFPNPSQTGTAPRAPGPKARLQM